MILPGPIFKPKNNSELVAILGNFVNRTLVLTHKYYNGHVPSADTYTKEDLLIFRATGCISR